MFSTGSDIIWVLKFALECPRLEEWDEPRISTSSFLPGEGQEDCSKTAVQGRKMTLRPHKMNCPLILALSWCILVMHPIYKELTFNRTFTEQFKSRRVDTGCNKIIFLLRLGQGGKSLMLRRRCNIPKLEATSGHCPSFSHTTQRTQRNSSDWV